MFNEKEWKRNYRLTSKDKIAAYLKKFKLKNPDYYKTYQKEYVKKHREKINERNKNYYKNNEEYRFKQKVSKVKSKLKSFLDFDFEKYQKLIKLQNNLCAICDNSQTKKSLNIDHDHITGKVRGLLCHKCNLGLGNFNDDIILLKKAIDYLN